LHTDVHAEIVRHEPRPEVFHRAPLQRPDPRINQKVNTHRFHDVQQQGLIIDPFGYDL